MIVNALQLAQPLLGGLLLLLLTLRLVQARNPIYKLCYIVGLIVSIVILLLTQNIVFITMFIGIIYFGGTLIFMLIILLALRITDKVGSWAPSKAITDNRLLGVLGLAGFLILGAGADPSTFVSTKLSVIPTFGDLGGTSVITWELFNHLYYEQCYFAYNLAQDLVLKTYLINTSTAELTRQLLEAYIDCRFWAQGLYGKCGQWRGRHSFGLLSKFWTDCFFPANQKLVQDLVSLQDNHWRELRRVSGPRREEWTMRSIGVLNYRSWPCTRVVKGYSMYVIKHSSISSQGFVGLGGPVLVSLSGQLALIYFLYFNELVLLIGIGLILGIVAITLYLKT